MLSGESLLFDNLDLLDDIVFAWVGAMAYGLLITTQIVTDRDNLTGNHGYLVLLFIDGRDIRLPFSSNSAWIIIDYSSNCIFLLTIR